MEMDMQEPGEMKRCKAIALIPANFIQIFSGAVGMHVIRIITTVKSCIGST